MAEITATLVKQLRDATNVSMMECKRALTETDGDLEKATRLLRERGMAVAQKRAGRTANQGIVASAVSADGTVSLVEINSETDFVARNENFRNFVSAMAQKALETDEKLADVCRDDIVAKISEIGENIVAKRNVRFQKQGTGAITSYIHMGGKVGVLVDLACGKPETAGNETFKSLLNDLALHVAACAPRYLTSAEVPAEELAAEREIYAKQVEGKPANIVGKIVDGKIKKFYADICLVDQGFVKEPKQSVTELVNEKAKELGDTLTIRRFARYQLGE